MIKSLIKSFASQIARKIIMEMYAASWEDKALILQAKNLIASDWWQKDPDFLDPKWIQRKEFRVYSQFGDDGIIQWLVNRLNIDNGNFIEFGVGDFFESNSHFLLVNNGWKGFVIDGSVQNINRIISSDIYWRFSLIAKQAFINKSNINELILLSGFNKAGYLHIDLDGNDYWILEALNFSSLLPDILVLEYNAIFGSEAAVSVPYDPKFYRMNAHYTGKYWGASLSALNYLAEKKGYYFVGCNSAGNNAYFLLQKYKTSIPQVDLAKGFQTARFREARDQSGVLTYLDQREELKLLAGLPVINVVTNAIQIL